MIFWVGLVVGYGIGSVLTGLMLLWWSGRSRS